MPLKLDQPRKKQLISLTPLIDVVFILLLFFMLTSSFVAWRVLDTPLSAPQAEVIPEQDRQDPAMFELRANDGLVWFDGQSIAVENSERIRSIVQDNQGRLFVLQAEDSVSLQSLMTLADQLKLQGAEKLSIANAFSETQP
ncbi:biopolymer transport protein ExbD [Marinomonas gallaica]|uniref:Biopolymer transport protein ExbD n=1 Tax=Marinomonas gallaica TaxID=1806667 RepID=A0A1C3JLJ3_9GAMM|nr:biopolymer transporter ExbD [Marinomonas gallaica]SBT16031.1 biopolymer transport protein ExbD [Marinomonas gallaica]SBT21079.1 biopolymer transport protein ExbD [Marinomonas gallaica]